MGSIACLILNKLIPKKVTQMTTILKRDAIERKDPLKLNKYQKKIVR